MKLYSACELARLANVSPLTFATHQKRGTLPLADVRGGRLPLYSEALGAKILHFYQSIYVPYKRHGTWEDIVKMIDTGEIH